MASVKIRLGEIRHAAAQYGNKLSRAPKGARGKIAPNTLLRKEDSFLVVDTPFLSTGVPIIEGRWAIEVAVHPKNFSDMLNTYSKVWKDVGGDNAEVWLESDGKTITLTWEDGKSSRSQTMPASRT